MSLKSIEMQIAIPRTNEATSVQNQMQHKPGFDQSALAGHSAKQTEKERQRSSEIEETSYLNVRDEGSSSRGKGDRSGSGRRNKQVSGKSSGKSVHPYKGKHIDISL
ncbi:hypothetical protein [Paenibacillus thermotolerans]|uniref:hypothetical protein n=1 Tax=Paenibacillus thermotolerans TaxID=3027807 RepID=UPI002368BD81|nr:MULTISPECIES: hypothetical protein [unclassified Paenibacillus]